MGFVSEFIAETHISQESIIYMVKLIILVTSTGDNTAGGLSVVLHQTEAPPNQVSHDLFRWHSQSQGKNKGQRG